MPKMISAIKSLYLKQKVLMHFRIKKLKDNVLGEKKLHLVEPYTVWVSAVDNKLQPFEYRKVYYWRGRKLSPFHRTHGKGIELRGGVILSHQSVGSWLAAIQKAEEEYTGVMSLLRKVANDCATERMKA